MALLDVASEICKLNGTRGKVMQDAVGKVYIFDCHHWSEECTHMLRFLCPNAVLSVESSVASLSGFVVVVQQEQKNKARMFRKRMLVAVGITALIYTVLAFARVFSPRWLDYLSGHFSKSPF
jgi:hypothetical protein